jgi:hypothetical protein
MPKRSSKRVNVLAHQIVAEASGEEQPQAEQAQKPEKNPAAVELGRLGGLKGGKARAQKLSAKRRSEISKKAAAARWRKKPKP